MVNIQNIIRNNLLLFIINIWIKKPQMVNIQNIFSRNNKSLSFNNIRTKKPMKGKCPKYC
jgi:uncharacterized membrane protein